MNRRLRAVDRPADRVAVQPRPAMDLALRQTLDEVQPTDLGPLLRPTTSVLPSSLCADEPRLEHHPDEP